MMPRRFSLIRYVFRQRRYNVTTLAYATRFAAIDIIDFYYAAADFHASPPARLAIITLYIRYMSPRRRYADDDCCLRYR